MWSLNWEVACIYYGGIFTAILSIGSCKKEVTYYTGKQTFKQHKMISFADALDIIINNIYG